MILPDISDLGLWCAVLCFIARHSAGHYRWQSLRKSRVEPAVYMYMSAGMVVPMPVLASTADRRWVPLSDATTVTLEPSWKTFELLPICRALVTSLSVVSTDVDVIKPELEET